VKREEDGWSMGLGIANSLLMVDVHHFLHITTQHRCSNHNVVYAGRYSRVEADALQTLYATLCYTKSAASLDNH
jgi:hypothetical protein